jgi:glycosyltransferase involved in cell wall biosynthesis
MVQSRKLRVMTLTDRPFEVGGAEALARTIATRLDPARFDRVLCATRHDPLNLRVDPMVAAAGVRVLSLERGSRAAIAAWWPLISFLRDHRVDVLHTHKFGSNLWGTLIGRLAGVPVIIAHEHTWSFEGQSLRCLLDRSVIARAADVVLAVSREDRRKMVEVEHIDPSRIRFIPNGIDPKSPHRGVDVRAQLGIASTAPVIGCVGNLRPQKALHYLIECATTLVREFPDVRVLIVGGGSDEARIRSLVRERDLSDTVLLLGDRSDVPDILAALDVAVSTSDWEGSPLAMMEYMAAGKPIVATRVGGVPDLVTHGANGLLVEPGDVDGLAGAIVGLLRDPKRRAVMGASGRRRQRLEFDIDLMLRRLELLYEELFRVTNRARRERWAPSAREA